MRVFIRIYIRVFGDLDKFLTRSQRNKVIYCELNQSSTVKDVIESLGIPHTEVDLIFVNNESKDFGYLLRNEDFVSVYPMFVSFDISSISRVRALPLKKLSHQDLRFVVDVNLGKLAHFLRMLGFDVLFDKDLENDATLASISEHENRVLLTRDIGLLKRKNVIYGYYVRNHLPKEQTLEILRRFDLLNFIQLCSRCLECNTLLQPIEKSNVLNLLPPLVVKFYSKFYVCPHCQKIYWEGTHFEHMKESVEKWKKELSP